MKTCDVALIQEPWTYKGAFKGLKEVGGELIYSRSTLNPRTCISIKKGFQILLLMHHCSRDLTALKIKTSSGGGLREIILESACLPYDDVVPPPPWELEKPVMGCRLLELTSSLAVMQIRITLPGEVRTPTTEVSPCLITSWLMDWTQ